MSWDLCTYKTTLGPKPIISKPCKVSCTVSRHSGKFWVKPKNQLFNSPSLGGFTSLLHISRLIDRMCLGLAFNSCFSSTRVVYDLLDAFSLLLLAWMIVGRFVLGTHSISAVTVMVEKTEEVKTRRGNQGMWWLLLWWVPTCELRYPEDLTCIDWDSVDVTISSTIRSWISEHCHLKTFIPRSVVSSNVLSCLVTVDKENSINVR